MELKLARVELTAKPKAIALEKILEELDKKGESMFYFDKSNPHKEVVALMDKLGEVGYNAYLKELRYGLDEDDYLYQVHAV